MKTIVSVFLYVIICSIQIYAVSAEEINLNAKAAVIMDAESGKILYEKSKDQKMPNASTTKILTCLYILKHCDLDQMAEVSKNAAMQPKVRLGVREGEKSIALHPFTKEVQEYYAHSSMYVLSSRWEGFGLVMIEAMAHGLPVIASDLPITRELLKDKDMAVLFETGNIGELAGCMSYMADRTDWEWMGNKAVEYADTFHIEKVCDSWNN